MILAVLLQTGSVSRAAKRLGMSQPTVSRALNQLRGLMADPLLIRSAGGMVLTQRALELAQPLEEWLAVTSTILQPAAFTPDELDRRFVIAASDYGVLSVIAPMLPVVQAQAPKCRIEVAAYSDDMFSKLAAGEIDVIVHGFEPDLSLTCARPLFKETQSVIVRKGHPLACASAKGVRLDDYLAWPHVAISIGADRYDHVRSCLAEHDAHRQVLVRLPYFYAAPDLIGASDAILTMPTRAAEKFARLHGFVCLPAPEQITGFQYWAVVHERSVRDAGTQWLIEMLSTTASDSPVLSSALAKVA
jgi:DNA-binding transcriptional LysR family regulator